VRIEAGPILGQTGDPEAAPLPEEEPRDEE
jgi:hypothetical protein